MYVLINTTLQVPHARAGSCADVGSANFNDVFFARGERDVPRLEGKENSRLLLVANCNTDFLCFWQWTKHQTQEPVGEGTRLADLARAGNHHCQ